MIQDLVRKYLANGLQDFKGLRVVGSIPFKDALLNEALTALLTDAPRAHAAADPAPPPFDLQDFRSLIKRVSVQADEGIVTLTFEIAVD